MSSDTRLLTIGLGAVLLAAAIGAACSAEDGYSDDVTEGTGGEYSDLGGDTVPATGDVRYGR